jgi:hypothetical protein
MIAIASTAYRGPIWNIMSRQTTAPNKLTNQVDRKLGR